MVGSTLFCVFHLLLWFPAIRADGDSSYTTILATNSRILYFPSLDFNADPSCSTSPKKDCDSRWWQEDNPHNETGFGQVVSTRGVQTILQLVFTKSTTIKIVAYVDGQIDTRSLIILNGQPEDILTNGPNLYGKTDLDTGTNTLCVQYNDGSGVLRIAGFYLDAGGEVLDSQDSNHPCVPSPNEPIPPSPPTASSPASTHVSTLSRTLSSPTFLDPFRSSAGSTSSQTSVMLNSSSSYSATPTISYDSTAVTSIVSTPTASESIQTTPGQSNLYKAGIIGSSVAAGVVLMFIVAGFVYIRRSRRLRRQVLVAHESIRPWDTSLWIPITSTPTTRNPPAYFDVVNGRALTR